MLQLKSLVFLLSAVSSGALGATVSTNLPIVNKVISPDGYSRDTVLAGGTFPGPIIKGNRGDTFQITVQDQLTDTAMDTATTIHWHGIDQKRSNSEDGVAFVTQCPIIPGNSFQYKFTVPDQAGTFWYHSHFNAQYCDGLRGPLVVYDPKDPQAYLYDIDNDSTVITLADWYHYLSFDAPPVPAFNTTLINGLGRDPLGTANTTLAVVNVTKGKRYRFRIVSISCDPNFYFSIDGHPMTIIEVDGNNVKPLVVDQIQIFAAQRYSVVVNANQPVGNYWIRALPDVVGGTNYDRGTNSAILRYAGAPAQEPATITPPAIKNPLLETNLHPLVATPVPGVHQPGKADININLDVVLNAARTNFLVNNVTYAPPSVPVLLQILSGAKQPSQLLPQGSIYGLQPNKTVEIVIPGGAIGGPHPVHLHGHSFFVVRSANSSTYNWNNPVIRDVVNIGDTGDEVTIRFVTDNPGPWFIHCHIDWHLQAGFAAIMAEDVPDVAADVPVTSAWQNLCPEYNTFAGKTTQRQLNALHL